MNTATLPFDPAALEPGTVIPPREIAVDARLVILGATTSRDWQPIHHDRVWARDNAGLPDIIMNNYTQAGLVCAYLTDWAGPLARPASLELCMRGPVCPGTQLVIEGTVKSIRLVCDGAWYYAQIAVRLTSSSEILSAAEAGLVLSTPGAASSPWSLPDSTWADGFVKPEKG